jgi:hypothetical protein
MKIDDKTINTEELKLMNVCTFSQIVEYTKRSASTISWLRCRNNIG